MHDDIYDILSNIPELVALVDDRIRPVSATINTPDVAHCTYSITATESSHNLDGPGQDTPYNLEIIVYHPDISQLSTAMASIKEVLNGYRDSTYSFQYVWFTGESESTDQDETNWRSHTYGAWV